MSGKKAIKRFPLNLPEDVDREVRQLAETSRPPATINDTIVYLIREALQQVKQEAARA